MGGALVGLNGMQERALIVGGQVEITSAPGHGTVVDARFRLI
jgi:signal transduction histidine kinase